MTSNIVSINSPPGTWACSVIHTVPAGDCAARRGYYSLVLSRKSLLVAVDQSTTCILISCLYENNKSSWSYCKN